MASERESAEIRFGQWVRKQWKQLEKNVEDEVQRWTGVAQAWIDRHPVTVLGIIYALGLLVWSFTAWSNGLGLVRPSLVQQFVAGVVPALTILIAYVLLRFMLWLPKWTRATFHFRCSDTHRVLSGPSRFALLLTIVTIFVLIAISNWAPVAGIIASVMSLVLGFFSASGTSSRIQGSLGPYHTSCTS